MNTLNKRKSQSGQAMVLSLILMSLTIMVVLFAFNASQLNIKSNKLQNTADNTAYSVASIAARDFNFKAYTNRAAIANQVAVAQLVGLSSWFNMTNKFAENACDYLCWVPYLGQGLSGFRQVVGGINNVAQPVFEALIYAENAILLALSGSQQMMHYAGLISAAQTAKDIVKANDSKAELDWFQNPLMLGNLRQVWLTFQKRHNRSSSGSRSRTLSRNGRQFQDYTGIILDSRDPFSKKRTYSLGFPWSLRLWPVKWKTYKTGGSELTSNGRNEAETWTSMDTLSVHYSRFRCGWSGCRWRKTEIPVGWGGTRSDNRADISRVGNRSTWGRSRSYNRTASRNAGNNQQTKGWYSGVQPFYGLSNSANAKSHTDNITIVVSKSQADSRTTHSIDVGGDNTDPAIDEQMLGDRLSAISAAQAYYSRPKDLMTSSSWRRPDNRHEYGNLYNPFWQPRLTDTTTNERRVVLALTRIL